MVSDPLRVALLVAEIFESLDIPYLIGDAIASAIVGEPRATEDIDIVADIPFEKTDALRAAIPRRGSFNIIYLETMRKVDVFVLRESGLDPEEMRRRIRDRFMSHRPRTSSCTSWNGTERGTALPIASGVTCWAY